MSEMQIVSIGGRQSRKSLSQQIAEACNLTQKEKELAVKLAVWHDISIKTAEAMILNMKSREPKEEREKDIVTLNLGLEPIHPVPDIPGALNPPYNRAERRKKIGSSPRYTQRKRGRKR